MPNHRQEGFQMIDERLLTALRRFIANPKTSNAWLFGDYLSVYVRRNDHMKRIEIANVSGMDIKYQCRGIFYNFMDNLELFTGFIDYDVYIENVMSPQLVWYYDRRGYIIIVKDYGCGPCMVKSV